MVKGIYLSLIHISSGAAPEHTAPEKLTVLVVQPMKELYVKEIDPGLHALKAEVGGDIAASFPFDDPVGLVLNDEGKLIGLEMCIRDRFLNRENRRTRIEQIGDL